jgi:hypothetical protein
MADARIELILGLIDEAFDRKAWHGTNLRGSIRGLTAKQAAWRPQRGRHNIWEIVVHAAYWKYTVRRRLRGERRGSFGLKGSNWFPRPLSAAEGTDAAWAADVRLLVAEHRKLRALAASLPGAQLEGRTPGSALTRAHVLRGIAAHDLYHAGQIQLLKRLQPR